MSAPDRKIQPVIIPVTPGNMIGAQLYHLDNRVPVYAINAGEEEIVRIDFIFRAGHIHETMPLLASSVSLMLTEGSENYSAEEINKTLDFYGAVPNQFTEKDSAGLSIAFLTKYSIKILELCREILFRPVFPTAELEALMRKRLQWFNVSRERVMTVASDKFFEAIFGSSHPYGRVTSAEDFTRITPELLSRFHSSHYTTDDLTIIVAGRIPDEMISQLNFIFGLLPASLTRQTDNLPLPVPGKPGRITLEKKNAIQAALRIGSITIGKRHPDYHGLKIFDTILGGYFGSRLMKNIREGKGYTYGINSSVVSFELAAYKSISTEVGIEHVAATINEIGIEIRRLQNEPVGYVELELVRNYMLGEIVRMFDGPFATTDSFRAVWEFGLDYSYYTSMANKIRTIGADEIMHIARTYYKIEDLFEIVVGPE